MLERALSFGSREATPLSRRAMMAVLAIGSLQFSGCSSESLTGLPYAAVGSEQLRGTRAVNDLAVVATDDSTAMLRWTQVGDEAGRPASYRLRYSSKPLDLSSGRIGCEVTGEGVGSPASCKVDGLEPGTGYHFQLVSYRSDADPAAAALYSNVADGATTRSAGRVADLTVTNTTATSVTVRWTQVPGGSGRPASYRLKYGPAPLDWASAMVGCDRAVPGTRIGAMMSCTIEGLPKGATYDFQLMAFESVDGGWQGATSSNVVTATSVDTPTSILDDSGLWVRASRLRGIPASGPAWENIVAASERSCGRVDLTDQEQTNNVCVMAKALVFARTGETEHRSAVVKAISEVVSAPKYRGRALSLGRALGTYVLAADLVDLPRHDPSLDRQFRDALRTLRTTYTSGAATDLIDCHEKRPNNWGAHCGASRIAIAAYLDDKADLERAARVFKGYIGDRTAYAGFKYGADLSWQCDPTRPVGINPAGCSRSGLSLDGVLADDQRRGGTFTTSPPKENYVWEAMQGLLAQAVILDRVGYPAFEWEDRALLRAARWLHSVNDYPAEGDDTWQTPLLNHVYGSSFPVRGPTQPGKNVGWTDWTHAGRR